MCDAAGNWTNRNVNKASRVSQLHHFKNFICFAIRNLLILCMNFLHYLYIKGETTLNDRLSGRSLIVFPIFTFSIIFVIPLMPSGIGEFYFYLLFIGWLGILYGMTYLILPPKIVKKRLRSWLKKYKKTTSLWAFLYLLSPTIFLILFTIYVLKFR